MKSRQGTYVLPQSFSPRLFLIEEFLIFFFYDQFAVLCCFQVHNTVIEYFINFTPFKVVRKY